MNYKHWEPIGQINFDAVESFHRPIKTPFRDMLHPKLSSALLTFEPNGVITSYHYDEDGNKVIDGMDIYEFSVVKPDNRR